jgi:iron complex outermembrane recepter protein
MLGESMSVTCSGSQRNVLRARRIRPFLLASTMSAFAGGAFAQSDTQAAPIPGAPVAKQPDASQALANVRLVSAAPGPVSSAAEGSASDSAPFAQLEEVVVTAEHRTESLQKTNIAASALSAIDLTEKSVSDIATLQEATPSLSVINEGFAESLNIRGIGLAVTSPSVDPGIATYRDGAFLPTQTSLNQPFYDLDNVQVLRGPQGTFAGQDATGGAIYVNSKSPSLTAGTTGYFTAGYGNYNDLQFNGAINLPVNDTLALRVAFNDQQRSSFYTNLSPTANGSQPGNLDQTDLRVGLLWQPTQALSVLWKTEYDIDKNDSFADQPIPGTSFYDFAPKTPFVIDYATPGVNYINTYVLSSLQANYQFADGITLKTNTAYQYDAGFFLVDQAAAPIPGYSANNNGIERVWTEDASLVSPDNQAFRWVVGGTFFNYTLTPVTSLQTTPVETEDVDLDTTKRSYGAFASVTYALTPTLDLQAGVRHSNDEVDTAGHVTISIPAFALTEVVPLGSPAYSDNAWTGKVALNWNPDAINLIYIFGSKGYKAGGANAGSTQSFAPETVWDYEAGWKTTVLGGHLRNQFGVFYTNYKDFQVSQFSAIAGAASVINAGTTSTIKGFEEQAQLQLGAFGADTSVAYVHSNIGSLPPQIDQRNLPDGGVGLGPQCAPGQTVGCFNYTPYVQPVPQGPNIYSPEWTANVGVQYAFDLGQAATLSPRVDVSYTSQQWATYFEAPEDNLKARTLVNAQLTYQHAEWSVQAYGTNLFDQVYVSGFSANFGNNYFLLPPRQFGVRFTRRF